MSGKTVEEQEVILTNYKESTDREREFVPRDQVFPLFFVYSLLLLHKNKWFYASFIQRNRSGLFLSAYFLF